MDVFLPPSLSLSPPLFPPPLSLSIFQVHRERVAWLRADREGASVAARSRELLLSSAGVLCDRKKERRTKNKERRNKENKKVEKYENQSSLKCTFTGLVNHFGSVAPPSHPPTLHGRDTWRGRDKAGGRGCAQSRDCGYARCGSAQRKRPQSARRNKRSSSRNERKEAGMRKGNR